MALQQLSRAQRVAARMPRPLQSTARRLIVVNRHRGLKAADLMMASYPKSGSTWLRFVLAGVLSGREMDFDAITQVSPLSASTRVARRSSRPAAGW